MEVNSPEESKLKELYCHHKRIISHWEVAFYKSSGKKPSREDLISSPAFVLESYRQYREIKKVLASFKESSDESNRKLQKSFFTPSKIFGKFRTRSDSEIQPPGSTEKTHARKTSIPDPGVVPNTVKPQPILYKSISNLLLSTSNEAIFSELELHSPSQPHKSENKIKYIIDEQSNSVKARTVEGTTEIEDIDDGFPTLKPRKGQIFSIYNNSKERTVNVSVISEFMDHDDDDEPSFSSKDTSRLRHVDCDWLKRCDQELMGVLNETVENTSEVGSTDVNNDTELCDISRVSGISPANSDNQLVQNETATQPSAVFDVQEQEYAGILNETQMENGENSTVVLSMDIIREVFKEMSQSASGSLTSQLEPSYLDPYAFNPTISTDIENERNIERNESMVSPNSNKRPNLHLSEEETEEQIGPKRKFFKHRIGGIPRPALRPTYKPLTPVKKKSQIVVRPKLKSTKKRVASSKNSSSKTYRTTKVKSSTEPGQRNVKPISSTIPAKKSAFQCTPGKRKVSMNVNSIGGMSGTSAVSDVTVEDSDIFETIKTSSRIGKKGKRVKLTTKEYLEMKVNTGRVNENFVRTDVAKKIFVRGRKKMTGGKMKRLEWKTNKANGSRASKIKLSKCRKCGDVGHFAKFCLQDQTARDDVPESTENSPFPTLQEAARMIFSESVIPTNRVSLYESSLTLSEIGNTKPEKSSSQLTSLQDITNQVQGEAEETDECGVVKPFISHGIGPVFTTSGSESHETKILQNCLHKFGYQDFRPGQQEAVIRTLRGLSTLVILSTGSGKSLCYQLPAYLYSQANHGAITLCVSPLISLMEDQLAAMPPFIRAACLHTMMTVNQREKVLEKVRQKKLQILLVSPEAICSGLFGLLRNVDTFPPVAFACIDEVHCVSEWSHNFRPSYLKVCKILREKLNVPAILGLTATATRRTSVSICEQLYFDPSTIIRGEIIPFNLNLSVSRDVDRDEALIFLLCQGRFKTCDSIIIYCTMREECERVARLIRTKIQDIYRGVQKTNLRQRISNNCEAYHAGMSGSQRRSVQTHFMSGKIRIVVATVAFGMGIDKSDIRAVIHYNMPKTFESYVQEIGRAGRDGLPAHCHLFLDRVKDNDLSELKRHVHANSVDRGTVRKLIKKIFKRCKCAKIESLRSGTSEIQKSQRNPCRGHEVSFSVADTAIDLDLAEENIETLLCYLELDTSRRWIEVLPKWYQICKIQSYGGPRLFKTAAQKCPAIAVAIALQKEKKKFKEDDIHLEFNLINAAATVGLSSEIVRTELKKLEWTGTEFDDNGSPTKFRKSGLIVEFFDLAHRMIAPGDLSDDEYDKVLELLHGHHLQQERTQLYQLDRVHEALTSVSTRTAVTKPEEFNKENSEKLKKFIIEYFRQDSPSVSSSWKIVTKRSEKEDVIRRDIHNLLLSQQKTQFTGRAIARIFHGIHSPCFPSDQWYRNRYFWRRHLDADFYFLSQIASQELISFN